MRTPWASETDHNTLKPNCDILKTPSSLMYTASQMAEAAGTFIVHLCLLKNTLVSATKAFKDFEKYRLNPNRIW